MIIIISLAKSTLKNENVILTLSTSEYANKKQQLKHTGKQVVSVPTTGVTASPALSVGPRWTSAHLVVGCFSVKFPLNTDLRSAFPPLFLILTIVGENAKLNQDQHLGATHPTPGWINIVKWLSYVSFLCTQTALHQSLRNGIAISNMVARPISMLKYCFHLSIDFVYDDFDFVYFEY